MLFRSGVGCWLNKKEKQYNVSRPLLQPLQHIQIDVVLYSATFVLCVAAATDRFHLRRETMFDNLTDRLSRTLRNISGRGRLTEDNIKDTLREVRMALLEADVALPVVRDFINRVKESAVGHEVNKSLTPGQEFVKIVRNELVAAMGEENQALDLAAQPPAVVLMAGLQGAGKTTSVAKLGKFLREKHKIGRAHV